MVNSILHRGGNAPVVLWGDEDEPLATSYCISKTLDFLIRLVSFTLSWHVVNVQQRNVEIAQAEQFSLHSRYVGHVVHNPLTNLHTHCVVSERSDKNSNLHTTDSNLAIELFPGTAGTIVAITLAFSATIPCKSHIVMGVTMSAHHRS